MRFLLAGVTGQLGHGIVEASADRADQLIPVLRPHGRLTPGERMRRLFPARAELAEHALAGDVSRPSWGLEPGQLRRLARDIDGVINVAAETDWSVSARRLAAVNTLGAVRGHDLARALARESGRRMTYCWASSVHVAGSATGLIAEQPLGPDGRRTPYEHSKWLGEQALLDPQRRGEVSTAIARIGGLLGNSQTGATARRHSLYMLADRWSRLPARVLPVVRGGRVDMLPREQAGDLLLRFASAAVRLSEPDPLLVHVCAGEAAPTTDALLAALGSIDITGRISRPRPVVVPARALMWMSENLDRVHALAPSWRNVVVGTRYLALDRIFERGRLARLVARPLPAPTVEEIARLAFELPCTEQPDPRELDRPLARFGG
jgi:nucleoside-diphosphate-sugar epimerase